MSPKARFVLGFIVSVATLVFFAHSLVSVWEAPGEIQWDFRTYYFAGAAYNQNLNPYSVEELSSVANAEIGFRFVYPPLTLELFKVLPLIGYDIGYKSWLILKTLALCLLVLVWKRYFLKDLSIFLIIPFTLFAFDGALFWDIKSGNISIFEQLALWLAFWAFLKDKYFLFIGLILVGSVFKFIPGLFIFLLLLNNGYKKWRPLGIGLILLTLMILANYLFNPELFHSFIGNLRAVDERASDFNYSMLAFWDDVYRSLKYTAHLQFRMLLVYGSYAATVISIILISLRGYLRLRKRGQGHQSVYNVLFLCCIYALIVPRFKCYSFILLIPACLYLLASFRSHQYTFVIIIFGMIPVSTPFFEVEIITRIFHYYPLFFAGMIWLCYIAICYDPEYFAVTDAQAKLIEQTG